LPEPQVAGLNFSFSGLKTSILYFLKEKMQEDPAFIRENLADICASVQERIVAILLKKLRKAARQTGIREVAISGGVSANSGLREGLEEMGKKEGWNTYIPRFEFCTDNAAMIAVAGYYKFLKGEFAGQDAVPVARMEW
ncbi:MAG: tRNA (adenosine(37)-N6)-threonylcarbamoyltransferase complex transferase subunit TsaD, partial [Bacteroidota bacterium]